MTNYKLSAAKKYIQFNETVIHLNNVFVKNVELN
jgi:hypothetical protein